MFSANDSLVEFFLNRESDSAQLKLEVWRSVAASALYLTEKNFPYTSNPRREVRGELDIPDYVRSVSGRPYCLSDAGVEEKFTDTWGPKPSVIIR